MIPVSDIIPRRTPPVVTIALIALNVLAFSAVDRIPLIVALMYLWIFGGSVEDRFGHGRFAVFYLLCGVIAAALQSQVATAPLVGSGAAVSGVLGAYFVLYPTSRVLALVPLRPIVVEIPAAIFLAFWFLLQIAVAFGPAAFVGPIAGFVTGVLLTFVMRRPERAKVEWWSP